MNTHNKRIAKMTFAPVYSMYLTKVEKKGRTKEELHMVIEWLTGFDNEKLQELINENVTFKTFFQHASLNHLYIYTQKLRRYNKLTVNKTKQSQSQALAFRLYIKLLLSD